MERKPRSYGNDFIPLNNITNKEKFDEENVSTTNNNNTNNNTINTTNNIDTMTKPKKVSIGDMFLDLIKKIKYKYVFWIFILFILLNSDIMVNNVISKFSGAVEQRNPTGYGVFIQGLVFSLCFLIIDALSRANYI